MSQMILEPTNLYVSINDKTLSNFLQNTGSAFGEEKNLLATAIKEISAQKGYISNKQLIIWLITQLETSKDVLHNDLVRRSLEVVVGFTQDDI